MTVFGSIRSLIKEELSYVAVHMTQSDFIFRHYRLMVSHESTIEEMRKHKTFNLFLFAVSWADVLDAFKNCKNIELFKAMEIKIAKVIEDSVTKWMQGMR